MTLPFGGGRTAYGPPGTGWDRIKIFLHAKAGRKIGAGIVAVLCSNATGCGVPLYAALCRFVPLPAFHGAMLRAAPDFGIEPPQRGW